MPNRTPEGLPCVPGLPSVEFRGPVRHRPFDFGTRERGFLTFDYAKLQLIGGYGPGLEVGKADVRHILLTKSMGATRVSIVRADGRQPSEYFVLYGSTGIREKLVSRGWPVLDQCD